MTFESIEKSKSTAYLCWFFFSVHYFYLDKPFINILFWITLGGLGIWCLIDLFRIPSMVRAYNNNLLDELIEESIMACPNTNKSIEAIDNL